MIDNNNLTGDPEVPGSAGAAGTAKAGDPEVPGNQHDTFAFQQPEAPDAENAQTGDPEVPGSSDS